MVTGTCGRYPEKEKADFGIAETIRWIDTEWSCPNRKDEYVTLLPDGTVKMLWYGRLSDIWINIVEEHWDCKGAIYEGSREDVFKSIEDVRGKWDRYVWYEIEYYHVYEDDKYLYHIYSGENKPKYYLESRIGQFPNTIEAEEYWEFDGQKRKLMDGPCPYSYPIEEVKENNND